MGHRVCSVFATPGMMVLRLNQSLKYGELIPTPDSSDPAPAFFPFYREYSAPPVMSTMQEKTLSRCPQFSCRKMFTSDSWLLKHIKLHHPEHLQVAKNLAVRSVPQCVDATQGGDLNTNKDSVEDLDVYPYLEHIETIADTESQPYSPPQLHTDTYPGAGAPLCKSIAYPWEPDAQGFLQMYLQNNAYSRSAMRGEYQYIQCGIMKKGMQTYYHNVLEEEINSLHFRSFKNADGILKLVDSMPDHLALEV
jgi:hypothetical protein